MNHSDKQTLVSNFFSLTIVQCANYLLPLITLPYLYRILTAERYGLVVFAQACMQYFVILTDYGFSLSATREISTNRTNREEVSRIFSAVMVTKLALLMLSVLLLIGLIAAIPKLRGDWQIYVFAFGAVIGQTLFPLWFFQGMERMKYIALLNLLARLVFTALIFGVIRQKDDYRLVPLFHSLGFLVMGVLGLSLALAKFRIRLALPSWTFLRSQLRAAHDIFVAQIAISFYTASNVVVLGFFTSDATVGYYAAGEKIVRAVQGLEIPFSQAAYPYVSKLAHRSPMAALRFIRRATIPVGVLTGLASIALFASAATIARIVLGEASQQSTHVIRILAFLPLIVGLAIVYAKLFLLGFGLAKTWARIILFSGCLSLLGSVFFVGVLKTGYIGLCVNVLLTESLILVLSFLAYRKNRKRILNQVAEHKGSLIHADR